MHVISYENTNYNLRLPESRKYLVIIKPNQDDTCDHGLSRRSLRVKSPTVVELESKRDDKI